MSFSKLIAEELVEHPHSFRTLQERFPAIKVDILAQELILLASRSRLELRYDPRTKELFFIIKIKRIENESLENLLLYRG